MCTSDRGVSSAELRPDVEGGRAAAADDDVVCVGVVFAPIVLVAGGTCTWSSSLYSRGCTRQDQCARFGFYVFSPYNQEDGTRPALV
jgi:hypothetical protein